MVIGGDRTVTAGDMAHQWTCCYPLTLRFYDRCLIIISHKVLTTTNKNVAKYTNKTSQDTLSIA